MINWKHGFLILFISYSFLILSQTYILLNFFSNKNKDVVIKHYLDYEDTYIVLESLLKKFDKKNVKFKKTELMDILKHDISLFPVFENLPSTRRYTVGNIYFEFDENDNLIKIRSNPIRKLYKDKFSKEDAREIYGRSSISHFMIMHKNLIEKFLQGGAQMYLGIIFSIILFIGLTYHIIFEMKSKKIYYLKISISINIILMFSIFLSLFYYLYWIKITVEEVLRNTGFTDIYMIFRGFDVIFVFPTFLLDINIIAFFLLLFGIIRFFNYRKNLQENVA